MKYSIGLRVEHLEDETDMTGEISLGLRVEHSEGKV